MKMIIIAVRQQRFCTHAVFAAICLSAAHAVGQVAQGTLPAELGQIASIYNIDISAQEVALPINTKWGIIDGKTASQEDVHSYAQIFAPEFNLYPINLVQRSKLRRVVLCRDLSLNGDETNGMPEYENNALYLDVKRGNHDTLYLRKLIHHEFFHVIDYQDDGLVFKDDFWSTLNDPAFHYKGRGSLTQGFGTASILTAEFPGFLTRYSQAGVEEDKAEVFANLITESRRVELMAANGPILRAKIEQIKQLLKKFCPEVDRGFWDRVNNLNWTK